MNEGEVVLIEDDDFDEPSTSESSHRKQLAAKLSKVSFFLLPSIRERNIRCINKIFIKKCTNKWTDVQKMWLKKAHYLKLAVQMWRILRVTLEGAISVESIAQYSQ